VRAGPHRHTGGRVSMTGASIKLPAPRRRRTPGGKEVPAAAQRGAGFGDAHERRSSEPANCATANRQASSRVSARLRIATRPMLNYELPDGLIMARLRTIAALAAFVSVAGEWRGLGEVRGWCQLQRDGPSSAAPRR
jgi:hypothetical protein